MDSAEHQTEKQTIYWEGYYEGQKQSKEEIEQLKVLNRVNINKAHCLEEEVERLRNEKEWLISKVQRMCKFSGQEDYVKGVLLFEMQEALKDK